MQYLFEYTDTLNSPYEAFEFDSSIMVFPVRPHWHYFMEIIYMKSGTGLVECDGSHLIKIFRKWKGITPKQFRFQHIKKEDRKK